MCADFCLTEAVIPRRAIGAFQGPRGDDISEEMFAFEQRKREVQLAVLLQQRIQPYVDALLEDPQNQAQQQQRLDAWKKKMTEEARNLCQVG